MPLPCPVLVESYAALPSLLQFPEHPIAVYHVSGEYVALWQGGQSGSLNYEAALLETMTSFRRAGATVVITYAAPQLLDLLTGGRSSGDTS